MPIQQTAPRASPFPVPGLGLIYEGLAETFLQYATPYHAPRSDALLTDDLAGCRGNKPEHPISITKGQAEAALVLADTALARAVDDAAPHLGHELLNRQVETPNDQRRVNLDGTLGPADAGVDLIRCVGHERALSLAEEFRFVV